MPESGRTALSEAVRQLAAAGASGRLEIHSEHGDPAEILLAAGRIRRVRLPAAGLREELLTLGVSREAVAEAELGRPGELPGRLLEELLVDLGRVHPGTVDALVEQRRARLTEVLGWTGGSWVFTEGPPVRGGVVPPLDVERALAAEPPPNRPPVPGPAPHTPPDVPTAAGAYAELSAAAAAASAAPVRAEPVPVPAQRPAEPVGAAAPRPAVRGTDTAALLRELSSLGLPDDPTPPAPPARSEPPAPPAPPVQRRRRWPFRG